MFLNFFPPEWWEIIGTEPPALTKKSGKIKKLVAAVVLLVLAFVLVATIVRVSG